MKSGRNLKRNNLFLVRVWTEEGGDGSDADVWHGKVQRVVSGEMSEFEGLPALVEVLSRMLSGGRPENYELRITNYDSDEANS